MNRRTRDQIIFNALETELARARDNNLDEYAEQVEKTLQEHGTLMNLRVEEFEFSYCNHCRDTHVKDGKCISCSSQDVTVKTVPASDIMECGKYAGGYDYNDINIDEDALVDDNGEDGWWVDARVFVPYGEFFNAE